MREVRGNHCAMIFQEPMTSLNPVFTIGRQISEALIVHRGLGKDQARAETIRLLEQGGAEVASVIRGLTDEDLDREAETFIGRTSVATFIERAINFHPKWHLTSIQATFEPAGKAT